MGAASAIVVVLMLGLPAEAPKSERPEPARHTTPQQAGAYGLVDLNVKPRTVKVWVDGHFRGTCETFDGYPSKLALLPGTHHLRLIAADGASVEREIEVRAGHELNVGLVVKRRTK